MSEGMKIKAIAPWAGSKRNLAPEIVSECGEHSAWWELCCGSAAVTLVKPKVSMETLIDLNGDLTNLALCIQADDLCEQLEDRLHRTWTSNELFVRSAQIIKTQPFDFEQSAPDWERAYHYFVFCWMGRNGDSGTKKVGYGFCKRYTKNGGHAATRFKGTVDSLSAFNERMRDLTILRSDIFDELPRIEDADGVAMYVDPPYIEKGLRYVHDFDPEDHVRLADQLSRFKKTRVVVSYYDHPLLNELYPGWTKRPLKATKAMVNQGKRDKSGSTVAPEVLLINQKSYVEYKGLF